MELNSNHHSLHSAGLEQNLFRDTTLPLHVEPNTSQQPLVENQKVTQEFDRRVTVLGGGAYGQVIGSLFARAGYDVAVAVTSGKQNTSDAELTERADVLNSRFHEKFNRSKETGSINATADLELALYNRGLVIYAAPTAGLQSMASKVKVCEGTKVISVSKGFCIDGWTPSSVEELLNGPPPDSQSKVYTPLSYLKQHPNFKDASAFAVIAGPGFAKHIMNGKRFGLTVACENKDVLGELYQALRHANRSEVGPFGLVHVHATTRSNSIEIMAGMKNVTAISCGIAHALEAPEQITSVNLVKWQGIKEAILLSKHIAKDHERVTHTDFMLNITTDFDISSTPDSRNCQFGIKLVDGLRASKTPAQVLIEYAKTVEGIQGAHAAKLLSDPIGGKPGVRTPLINAIVDLLQGEVRPEHILHIIDQEHLPNDQTTILPAAKDIFRLEPWPFSS